MSDLIVISYPTEHTARGVWHELVKLQRDFLVDLDDAAVIRRDSNGKLHVTTPAHHGAATGTLSGFFWGTVIGLILLPFAPLFSVAGGLMGSALGVAGDLDIKQDFKNRAQDLVQPGTSAIFVVLRKAAPDRFFEGIRRYGGTVLRTSLAPDAEVHLMTALQGDQAAATPTQRRTQTAHAAHLAGSYGMAESATRETVSPGGSRADEGLSGSGWRHRARHVLGKPLDCGSQPAEICCPAQ
jgi:uncharacterized membrane protein